MNFALIFSGFLLGLASGGHCIAMCGAGSAWCLGASLTPRTHAQRLFSFHAGRITAYACIGALLGGAAAAFHALTQWVSLLRPLWTMANTVLFLFGLTLLITARQPLLLSATGQKLGKWFKGGTALAAVQPISIYPHAIAEAAPLPSPVRSTKKGLVLGLSWAFIPCGLLYSAWTLALFAGDPLSGALTAAAFAMASGAQLALAQWWFRQGANQKRAAQSGRWDRVGIRVAGAALCISAGYSIAMLAMGNGGKGLFCL